MNVVRSVAAAALALSVAACGGGDEQQAQAPSCASEIVVVVSDSGAAAGYKFDTGTLDQRIAEVAAMYPSTAVISGHVGDCP